ncbi:MAG: recombinase family protein [Defluviitaleaceae bacterium]|nr:recombinase family protein [Defluviitaleaceae bacterium]
MGWFVIRKFIAIYSRKSKFTGRGESIENQIEMCRQYIKIHYPQASGDDILIYEDEGFSGGNTHRPRFSQMLIDAKTMGFSAIVCYRLDRVSRNINDFAKLIQDLDELGICFVSIKEQFDTKSPMGRAMMYISSVFSQLERETIAERIRDNMHEMAKTGRWLGGIAPTGYASRGEHKLEVVEAEANIVKTIFSLFLTTDSLTRVEQFLKEDGRKTKNGKPFTRFAIRNILTNPVYASADEAAFEYFDQNKANMFAGKENFCGKFGIMAYGRTLQKAGQTHKLRPISEWVVAIGKHEPLICGADWVLAQEKLAQNSAKAPRKPRSQTAMLSGLLYCSCGSHMRAKTNRQKQYYLCAKKEKTRRQDCNMKNIDGGILDKTLAREVLKEINETYGYAFEAEQAPQLLRAAIDKIIWNGHEADIYLHGAKPL